MSAAQWGDVINTNLNSVFNVTRPVIEGMRDRKWGRIVQISSINGLKGQYGQANYAAAKAGMHGFTISLARENAKLGITVNTVSPGYIATDMVMAVPEEVRAKIVADIPTGRLGKPEEIAYAVGFLADDRPLDHRLQPRHQRRPPHGLVSSAFGRCHEWHLLRCLSGAAGGARQPAVDGCLPHASLRPGHAQPRTSHSFTP
jgi:NAD(P)-dependent dehydrogenase (short-subunit alcohol dehydrogenase family)